MNKREFYEFSGAKSAFAIAELIGAQIPEHQIETAKNLLICDIKNIENAQSQDLSFVQNKKYYNLLKNAMCAACIIPADFSGEISPSIVQIRAADAYFAYASAINLLYNEKSTLARNNSISQNAIIHEKAKIGYNVSIEEGVKIGPDVTIGDGACIKQGVQISEGARIGASSYIAYAYIGKNTIIHPGVRIGTDGFGFATFQGVHKKIFHIGTVIIGDDVEIGANSTIDRGSLQDTIIGSGTKIDNLVQIGHNVRLGKGCIVVAQVGIAGSTVIGDYVVIGGQAGIAGHINIEDRVQVAAQSGVISDIKSGSIVGGSPSVSIKDWHRQTIMLKNMIKKEE
ncbi:MAG: UDP-3-O-(3-hydroxymyristoyl)glucosamine N-acyltransferase [Rickettsiaceae bacterium]|nr:UDP-3-O-(3-hydroxymyristoyl)glucosamine N-acyltransferase [Rickettsiaceae bacterium]